MMRIALVSEPQNSVAPSMTMLALGTHRTSR